MFDKLRKYLIPSIALILILIFILPINLAFVDSNSMAPEIETGDMFFVQSSESYEIGDIIVFESSARSDSTIITHRIIEENQNGFITKGDNNDATDQELGDAPVSDQQIIGKVIESGDSAVTVPELGVVSRILSKYQIQLIGGIFALLFVDTIGLYSLSSDRNKNRSNPDNNIKRYPSPIKVTIVLSIVLIVLWSGLIYLSSEPVLSENVRIGEAETDDISTGERSVSTVNYSVSSRLPVNNQAYILGNGKVLSVDKLPNEDISVRYATGPYNEPGLENVQVLTYSYPTLLPSSVITYLHNIHPILACIGTSSVISMPIVLVVFLLFDNSPIRVREK